MNAISWFELPAIDIERAQKFYEKQGWQNLGFRFSEEEWLNKKCEQLFLMQKILK